MGKSFWIAVAVASAAMAATPAAAVSFEQMAGKWCSDWGSEQFTRESLTVIRKSDGSRSVYPIVRYDDRGNEMVVYWKDGKGDQQSTRFGDFSSDGRQMTQEVTKDAPRIPHHRC